MRSLKFIVNKQSITQDPQCDFGGLVPGTNGYLKAEFTFSSDWNGMSKVAAFYSPLGIEYPPQILEDGKTCDIPAEALAKSSFKIQVIGKGADNSKLVTNKLMVIQNGGRS